MLSSDLSKVDLLVQAWQRSPDFPDLLAASRIIPKAEAQFDPFPPALHMQLVQALHSQGIQNLYSHQVEAFNQVAGGKNIVIATGTSSGKTLCYNLPVLQGWLKNPQQRALYLFPTKALTYDQLNGLQSLLEKTGAAPSAQRLQSMLTTYDGDTPMANRSKIRTFAAFVMSNPDMLHTAILPHHTLWEAFFRNLSFVVIDEIHTYRGVFGSHVANVIRRLKRICQFYGSDPRFIMTSATIGNPRDHARALIEQDVELVDRDGSPHGKRYFMFVNPPLIDPELGIRKGAIQQTEALADDLLRMEIQALLFARTRRTVELVTKELREQHPESASSIFGYRSGYLAQDRREIESALRSGNARIVAATSALELGIDIGAMDAVLMISYPGTISGAWQRAGRAGRRSSASLAVMVFSSHPIDQYLAHHPDFFFGGSPEKALINPNNLIILLEHLKCAAFELPFKDRDSFSALAWEVIQPYIELLDEAGILRTAEERHFWMADQYPADAVSLRSSTGDSIRLTALQDGRTERLGEVDLHSAYWMVHPGAIYLHQGDVYRVDRLDLTEQVAELSRASNDYYTEPVRSSEIQIVDEISSEDVKGGKKQFGEIEVTSQVIGYKKIDWLTREILGTEAVDLPATTLRTTGYWITLHPATVNRLREAGQWNAAPNQYGQNWSRQRSLARKRDHYTCRICGRPESGIEHHVHHKVPFRAFTSYLEANQLDNLITLCPTCHKLAEANVRIRSGLAGVTYAINNIAPLFLMCDPTDIGSHSDHCAEFCDQQAVMMVYDLVPAGIGLSQALYDQHAMLLKQVKELLDTCECTSGCPSCVGVDNPLGIGGKQETSSLLNELT